MSRAKSLLLILLFLAVAVSPALGRITFVPGQPFTVSRKPDLFAVGDFNRDGVDDLVVEASAADKVDVLIADGNGGFVGGSVLPFFGDSLTGVAVGDLNQDTLADIVLTDKRGRGTGRVWILLGRGDGTFKDGYSIDGSRSPWSPVLVDLDTDGDIDIAYVDKKEQEIFILLNDGTELPLFNNGGAVFLLKRPDELVTGLFDRNTRPDLMGLNTGGNKVKEVTFVRNDGVHPSSSLPVFVEAGNFIVGQNPWAMVSLDADGDKVSDVAFLNNETKLASSQLQLLYGVGNGFFEGPVNTGLPCPQVEQGVNCRAAQGKENLAAADFDLDGTPDFAATMQERDWAANVTQRIFVRFIRGLKNRRYVPKGLLDVDPYPYVIAVGKFAGTHTDGEGNTGPDDFVDVVVGSRSKSNVTIFINVSTTPAEPGEPCIEDEDCESEECIDGICCEEICLPDQTCAVPDRLGECVTLKDNGDDCNWNVECMSGYCTDGVCCEVDECPEGERCDIFGYEGMCHEKLDPGEPCDDNDDCNTGWCTDGVCCRVEICPPGDVCGEDGYCTEAPTPTATPQGPGGFCSTDADCDPGLWCVDGICCTVPECPNGHYCAPGTGECTPGTPPPTRTRTPTRIPSIAPPTLTPTCPAGFQPSGGLCTSVSRGGGCAIDPGQTSGLGMAMMFVLLPVGVWLIGHRRRRRK